MGGGFRIDRNILKDRPNGVSGLLRVKNESQFIRLSVESVIDALDELIIVYQESTDNTEEMILELQKKYPLKIKSFFYPYPVYSHNLDEETFNETVNLSNDSPNLLSSYYNFTLSKASYKYALKIDADQIYDSSKLKLFCDAYRAKDKVKIKVFHKLYATIFFCWYRLSYLLSKLNVKIELPIPPKFIVDSYESYVIKKIINDKNPVSFIGINLNYDSYSEKWGITLGDYSKGGNPPFNGVIDHLIFAISDKTYYLPVALKSYHKKYGNCVIERFAYDDCLKTKLGWSPKLLHGGFLWFHVAPLKQKHQDKLNVYEISSFTKYSTLKKSLSPQLFNSVRFLYKVFWSRFFLSADMQRNLTEIKAIVNHENEF